MSLKAVIGVAVALTAVLCSPVLAAKSARDAHVLIGLQLVVTDQVPALDVRPACRGTDIAEMSQATCLEDERAAHDELIKEWGHFSAQDKAMCTDATENYNPSYVELLTCLEIARDAKIPSDAGQDQQSGAVGQRF